MIQQRNEWQIYQNFIDNYARSQEAIRREEETNPQFRQFMKVYISINIFIKPLKMKNNIYIYIS